MTYKEPTAEILGAARSGDVTTTRLRVVKGTSPVDPIAPAGLYSGARGEHEILPLHKLVAREPEGTLVFESYGIDAALPAEGSRLTLRSWWDRRALDAVTNVGLAWQLKAYDESDHDHSLLTWTTILAGEEAYRSTNGDWVSRDAYERYIRDDLLRLRPGAS